MSILNVPDVNVGEYMCISGVSMHPCSLACTFTCFLFYCDAFRELMCSYDGRYRLISGHRLEGRVNGEASITVLRSARCF